MYKQVCDSAEFVGNLWEERERERGGRGRGRGRERGRGKGKGRGRGRGTQTDREGEWEEEGVRGGGYCGIGGNLCLAFEGWGSYNHPFV